MRRLRLLARFFCLLIVAGMCGCARKALPSQATGQQFIEADARKALARHPEPPYLHQPAPAKPEDEKPTLQKVPFTHEDNARVGEWLDSLQARNLRLKYAKGFRIQLYVGSDREAAFRAKESAYKLLKGAEVYMTYTLPTFKVQAGDYMDRIEAEHAFRAVRARHPDALIVSERILLRHQ